MRASLRFSLSVILLLALAPLHGAADTDYAAKFKELRDKKAPDTEIETFLTDWRAKDANNPEAWVASANFYFNQRPANISQKKPEKGDFALKDKKTDEDVGSISFPLDPENTKRAAGLLQEAIKKFPDRVDIWCGLAFIEQESGKFDEEMDTLGKMVAYVKEHPANLRWMNGGLSDPPDKFIPEKLHHYALYYEKKETEEDDKRFLKIALFAADQYPNHPYALNDVALYYSVEGNNEKTKEWLEKAHKADPKDTLVMINLGRITSDMGDDEAARKYFEEAIKTDPKGENAEEAKQALKELGKGTE